MSGTGAPDGAQKPFLYEIVIDGDAVSASVTDINTSLASTSDRVINNPSSSENNLDALPVCDGMTFGTYAFESSSAVNDVTTSALEHEDQPIAADYRRGTDEVRFMTTSRTFVSNDAYVGSIGTSYTIGNSCRIEPQGVLSPGPSPGDFSGATTGSETRTFDSSGTMSFKIAAANVQIDCPGLSIANGFIRTEALTFDLEYSGSPSFDITSTYTGSQTASQTRDYLSVRGGGGNRGLEMVFADIRYDTFILKYRFFKFDSGDFGFNSERDVWPGHNAGPQGVGPIVNAFRPPFGFPGGYEPEDVPPTQTVGVGQPPVPNYKGWSQRGLFVNQTIVARGSNVTVHELEDTEHRFASNITSGGGGQTPITYFSDFIGLTAPPGLEFSSDSSDENPVSMLLNNAPTLQMFPTTAESTRGACDRNGDLFYSVDIPNNDAQRWRTSPFGGANPDYDLATFYGYKNFDPAETIGMPANELNGPNGDPANTTRPLWGPIIAVQEATIPEEEEEEEEP
jgi:hypothetical protein